MEDFDKLKDDILKDDYVSEPEYEMIDTSAFSDGVLTKKEKNILVRLWSKFRKQEVEAAIPTEKVIEKICEDGVVTREEIKELHKVILADGKVSSDEQALLQQLVNKILSGKISEA